MGVQYSRQTVLRPFLVFKSWTVRDLRRALTYCKRAYPNLTLTRVQYADVFGLAPPAAADQFRTFDRDDRGVVSALEVFGGLLVVCKGKAREKLSLAFMTFDHTGHGFATLSRYEVVAMMATSMRGACRIKRLPPISQSICEGMADDLFKTQNLGPYAELNSETFADWFRGDLMRVGAIDTSFENLEKLGDVVARQQRLLEDLAAAVRDMEQLGGPDPVKFTDLGVIITRSLSVRYGNGTGTAGLARPDRKATQTSMLGVEGEMDEMKMLSTGDCVVAPGVKASLLRIRALSKEQLRNHHNRRRRLRYGVPDRHELPGVRGVFGMGLRTRTQLRYEAAHNSDPFARPEVATKLQVSRAHNVEGVHMASLPRVAVVDESTIRRLGLHYGTPLTDVQASHGAKVVNKALGMRALASDMPGQRADSVQDMVALALKKSGGDRAGDGDGAGDGFGGGGGGGGRGGGGRGETGDPLVDEDFLQFVIHGSSESAAQREAKRRGIESRRRRIAELASKVYVAPLGLHVPRCKPAPPHRPSGGMHTPATSGLHTGRSTSRTAATTSMSTGRSSIGDLTLDEEQIEILTGGTHSGDLTMGVPPDVVLAFEGWLARAVLRPFRTSDSLTRSRQRKSPSKLPLWQHQTAFWEEWIIRARLHWSEALRHIKATLAPLQDAAPPDFKSSIGTLVASVAREGVVDLSRLNCAPQAMYPVTVETVHTKETDEDEVEVAGAGGAAGDGGGGDDGGGGGGGGGGVAVFEVDVNVDGGGSWYGRQLSAQRPEPPPPDVGEHGVEEEKKGEEEAEGAGVGEEGDDGGGQSNPRLVTHLLFGPQKRKDPTAHDPLFLKSDHRSLRRKSKTAPSVPDSPKYIDQVPDVTFMASFTTSGRDGFPKAAGSSSATAAFKTFVFVDFVPEPGVSDTYLHTLQVKLKRLLGLPTVRRRLMWLFDSHTVTVMGLSTRLVRVKLFRRDDLVEAARTWLGHPFNLLLTRACPVQVRFDIGITREMLFALLKYANAATGVFNPDAQVLTRLGTRAVADLFTHFDNDGDGRLNIAELNHLQSRMWSVAHPLRPLCVTPLPPPAFRHLRKSLAAPIARALDQLYHASTHQALRDAGVMGVAAVRDARVMAGGVHPASLTATSAGPQLGPLPAFSSGTRRASLGVVDIVRQLLQSRQGVRPTTAHVVQFAASSTIKPETGQDNDLRLLSPWWPALHTPREIYTSLSSAGLRVDDRGSIPFQGMLQAYAMAASGAKREPESCVVSFEDDELVPQTDATRPGTGQSRTSFRSLRPPSSSSSSSLSSSARMMTASRRGMAVRQHSHTRDLLRFLQASSTRSLADGGGDVGGETSAPTRRGKVPQGDAGRELMKDLEAAGIGTLAAALRVRAASVCSIPTEVLFAMDALPRPSEPPSADKFRRTAHVTLVEPEDDGVFQRDGLLGLLAALRNTSRTSVSVSVDTLTQLVPSVLLPRFMLKPGAGVTALRRTKARVGEWFRRMKVRQAKLEKAKRVEAAEEARRRRLELKPLPPKRHVLFSAVEKMAALTPDPDLLPPADSDSDDDRQGTGGGLSGKAAEGVGESLGVDQGWPCGGLRFGSKAFLDKVVYGVDAWYENERLLFGKYAQDEFGQPLDQESGGGGGGGGKPPVPDIATQRPQSGRASFQDSPSDMEEASLVMLDVVKLLVGHCQGPSRVTVGGKDFQASLELSGLDIVQVLFGGLCE